MRILIRQVNCGNSSHRSTARLLLMTDRSRSNIQSVTDKMWSGVEGKFFSVTVMMRWILDGSMAFTPPPSFTLPAKLMGYEIWKAPFASSSSTTKSGSDQKQDQIEIHVAFYLLPTLDMKSWLIRNWIWLHSSVWWWWWFDGSGLHFAYLIGCASYFIGCWWYCKRLSSPAAGLEQVA